MSAILSSGAVSDQTADEFERLCSMVDLAQERFSLMLVSFDLPSTRSRYQTLLRERFANRRAVMVELAEIPADAPANTTLFDQLPELVRRASSNAPDILMINGIERVRKDSQRALQPLNMARNRLQKENPYPVLIWLPREWMAAI